MKTGIGSLSLIDLLLVLVVVIWGVNFTIVKIALLEMNPLIFNCFRVIVASVFLIILSCFKKSSRPSRSIFLQLFAIGLIGNGIYQELFILGIYRTAAGVTALILTATPIFVMIIDSILHVEKIGYREWIGVIFSFIGIMLMIHIESLRLCREFSPHWRPSHCSWNRLLGKLHRIVQAHTLLSKPSPVRHVYCHFRKTDCDLCLSAISS